MASPSAGEMAHFPTLPLSTRARSDILSLPEEVLSIIASHCDKASTALAFIYAHPHFSSINIDRHLWRALRLTVPEVIVPDGIASVLEMFRAVDAQSSRLKRKVRQIVDRADPRRAGMVTSIVMTPRPDAVEGIIQLLHRVSANVETLAIQGLRAPAYMDDRGYRPGDLLDRALLEEDISLPTLRTLSIGDRAISFAASVLHLCSLAPRLHTLIVNLPEAQEAQNPPPLPCISIQQLHISCNDIHADGGVGMSRRIDYLLRHLPSLRQVSVDFPITLGFSCSSERPADEDGSGGEDEEGRVENEQLVAIAIVVDPLGVLEHVKDLEWRTAEAPYFFNTVPSGAFFPSLRQLVLGPVKWSDWIKLSFNIPTLEAIFFSGLRSSSPAHLSLTLAQMRPQVISALRRSPRLHLLHVLDPDTLRPGLDIFPQLDEIEASPNPNGFISSYHHGEANIVHARLLVQLPSIDRAYTDYNGVSVPLEVLQAMRVAAGRTEGEWRGRGVEVGEEAWEVLKAWERGLAA